MMSPVNPATQQQRRYAGPSGPGASGGGRERALPDGPPQSPPAARAPRRSWKDPRLLVGLVIVAASVLAGARLLAAADDTVAVWAVRADLPEGTELDVTDLRVEQLRFGAPELAGHYLAADQPLPAGTVLTRDVSAGELLPREALAAGAAARLLEVPIALASDAAPAGLRPGEVVDVWVTPDAQSATEQPRALRVLESVRVVAVPSRSGALGPSSTQQVVVGLAEADQSRLPTALAQLSTGDAVVVRRG